eukprot:TRINITY_DN23314_c0_g2_i1.p1 TRINITY_DN23314_c0_g2~~TRINITY_DN23314_c0_g2_i1.p1  ORF type:complete len:377 (+),score=73.30 TRINITY_DN23314_c0_g2_i1:64-1194(+)
MLLRDIFVKILAAGLIQAEAQTPVYGIMTTTPAPGIGQRRRRQKSDGCQTSKAQECQSDWLDLLDTFSHYVWNEASFVYVGTGRAAGADCTSIQEGFEIFRQCMALQGCCEETFEKKTIAQYLVNISAEILKETTRKRDLCKFTTLPNECSAPDYTSLVYGIVGLSCALVVNLIAFVLHRMVKRRHAPEPPELGMRSLICCAIIGAPIACCFPIDPPGSEIITSMRKVALRDGMRVEAQGLALPGHWGWGRFEKYGLEKQGKAAAARPAVADAPEQHLPMENGKTKGDLSPRSDGMTVAEIKAANDEYQRNFQKQRQISSSAAARAYYERKEYELRKAAEPEEVERREAEAALARFGNMRMSRSMQSQSGLPGQLP